MIALPYVLALHAFGLEESGRYVEPRRADGKRSPSTRACRGRSRRRPRDGDAGPARRRPALDGRARARWGALSVDRDGGQRNGFPAISAGTGAVRARDADIGRALALFDEYLGGDAIEITLQRVDAASLLWRIALVEGDPGTRWRALLDGWRLDAESAGHSLFNDAHATMALLGAGEIAEARNWVAQSLAAAERHSGWNGAVARAIGAPLLQGLLAFGEERYGAATELIAPLRDRLAPFGGSRAQRDVVDQTLLAAVARGGDRSVGSAMLEERRRSKPTTPLTAHWSRRLAV
jgi:hypothetical protein